MSEIEKLIEKTKYYKQTPAQAEAQRRSFAFGNAKIENDRITRQMIDKAADKIGR
ncbi:MAG: hypothetical protein AAF205_08855 [Pseudomonadota bacterium]